MRIQNLFSLGVLLAAATIVGCGSNGGTSTLPGGGGNSTTNGTGGKANGGAATTTGGATSATTGNTGGSTGVTTPTGGSGTVTTGGSVSTATGGKATTATGGNVTVATGGSVTTATGGSVTTATGGSVTTATGGKTGTATGGSVTVATGGVTTATGGSTGTAATPTTPACPTGNNSEGVPNSALTGTTTVISDFDKSDATVPCVADPAHLANPCSDAHLITYKSGARGNTRWYGYTDYTATPDTSTTTASSLPTLTWESTASVTAGTCTTGGVMHIKGTGNTGWGSGIGVDLAPRNASNQKVPFDASAYTGIGFNMKCTSDVGYVYFKLIDAVNDGDCSQASCGVPTCVYSGTGTICNQYGYKNSWLTKNWANYELYFDDALQDPNAALAAVTAKIDKSKLTAMQMQFNTGYDTAGGSKVATSFDCYVDDVHFLTSAPPAAKTTCASGAYTTSGNKINCGSTAKVFRGVARPSMEWDTSGWNVMPWDMARIKNGWKANLVRIGLNQDFYMGTSTASTAQIYPKYVARAVRWAEANGMDVILDLHWTDKNHPSNTSGYMASAASNSPAFWTKLAGDFKSDTHVMFELYNEPTISSWSEWKTNYTALYNAVRTGAGATQIVIIGGLDWAYDLSGVTANAISGSNIVYNTHPYSNKATARTDWDAKFGNLSATQPVIATEFGTYDCTGTWTQSMISYFEEKGISWTAWGWYAGGGCSFPSLNSSYDGTTLPSPDGNISHGAAAKAGMAKNP